MSWVRVRFKANADDYRPEQGWQGIFVGFGDLLQVRSHINGPKHVAGLRMTDQYNNTQQSRATHPDRKYFMEWFTHLLFESDSCLKRDVLRNQKEALFDEWLKVQPMEPLVNTPQEMADSHECKE